MSRYGHGLLRNNYNGGVWTDNDCRLAVLLSVRLSWDVLSQKTGHPKSQTDVPERLYIHEIHGAYFQPAHGDWSNLKTECF